MAAAPQCGCGLVGQLQEIDRAHDLVQIFAGDVEINRGCLDAAMAHQALDVIEIAAALQ